MRYPGATWRGSPNYVARGLAGRPRGVVFHVEQGSEAGTIAVFSEAAWQASSHFGVARSGAVDQFVDTADRAWAEAAGNDYWWSIEHEGLSGQPLTAAQIAADAALIAWLRTIDPFPLQLTDDVNGAGLGWHGMGGVAWGSHTQCPGEPIKANRQDVIDVINLIRRTQLGATPNQRRHLMYVAQDSKAMFIIAGGFKTWITSPGDVGGLLRTFGQAAPVTLNDATMRAIPYPPGTPADLAPAV